MVTFCLFLVGETLLNYDRCVFHITRHTKPNTFSVVIQNRIRLGQYKLWYYSFASCI